MLKELEWLNEKYGAIYVGGECAIDVWELGLDLKVSLMSDGIYNDAFDRPYMYGIEKAVYENVRNQIVGMVAGMYMDEENVYFDGWGEVIDEWIGSFDEDTYNSLVATIDGLVNDLMKFAKGGQLYAESLKNENNHENLRTAIAG